MNALSSRFALVLLLGLAACAPPPGDARPGTPETPPVAEVKPEAAPETPAAPPATPPEARSLPAGEVRMRKAALPLHDLSLWHDDSMGVDKLIWHEAQIETVAKVFPALIYAEKSQVRDLMARIARSPAHPPSGMSELDYVRWRAAVLAQQKEFSDAATLMHMARLGRDDRADIMPRLRYQLAAGQTETACLEAMATGGESGPFWQGLAVLCAETLGDAEAAGKLREALPDGELRAATDANALRALLVKIAAPEAPAPIADNADMIAQLQKLLNTIEEAEDKDRAIDRERGQLLLLALGSLTAEKQAEDTEKLANATLKLLGI